MKEKCIQAIWQLYLVRLSSFVVQETAYCEYAKVLVIWNFKYLIYVTFPVISK